MKKLLSCLLLLLFMAAGANAQNDSSITYIAGEGLHFKMGKAESFEFNVLSTVQTGFQYNRFDSVNSNRFSLNLVRVAFNASVLKDKVSMSLVTDFTGTSPILEGWIAFSIFSKKGKLYIGQKQTHTNNRLSMADERFAQNMGQTLSGKSNDGIVYGGLMQNFVGATREGGIFLETNLPLGSQWRICPSLSITTGEGQNFFDAQNNTGFKYGGRLDILPLGNFIKNNAFIAEDIYREQKPRLAVGFAASYNVKAGSPIGSENQSITGIYDKKGAPGFANYGKLAADFILKYKGYSVTGEYINGTVHGKELYTNAGATNQFTAETASSFYNVGSAFNVLMAYVTEKGWSFGGRYTHVQPEFNTAASLVHEQDWYTLSFNKFMKSNAVKAGLNVTYLKENAVATDSKNWMGNLAIQISL